MASYIINAKWYQEREEKIEDESRRLVLAAAKLLKDDIRRRRYDTGVYPEAEMLVTLLKVRAGCRLYWVISCRNY